MDDKHVINCNDVPEIDMTRQDGGLEHKAGVYTYQIRRSCRTDGDYTYNHAPKICEASLISPFTILTLSDRLLSSTFLTARS